MRPIVPAAAVAALVLASQTGCSENKTREAQESPSPSAPVVSGKTGEDLFKERCAACHPDGGNTITPAKTLHRGVLARSGIQSPPDIVQVIRNPGPGMTSFDRSTISDPEAQLIAEYVLNSFR